MLQNASFDNKRGGGHSLILHATDKTYFEMIPSFLANLLRQSSDSPIRRMAPQMAYVLLVPVIRPVSGSTSAKFIWMEAWSLAAMIRFEAELRRNKRSSVKILVWYHPRVQCFDKRICLFDRFVFQKKFKGIKFPAVLPKINKEGMGIKSVKILNILERIVQKDISSNWKVFKTDVI